MGMAGDLAFLHGTRRTACVASARRPCSPSGAGHSFAHNRSCRIAFHRVQLRPPVLCIRLSPRPTASARSVYGAMSPTPNALAATADRYGLGGLRFSAVAHDAINPVSRRAHIAFASEQREQRAGCQASTKCRERHDTGSRDTDTPDEIAFAD
jgi:hypothetical protein